MASVEPDSEEVQPISDAEIVSNEPIHTASTLEKRSGVTSSQNVRSPQNQSVVQSSDPLIHEQILDIRQPVAQFIINTALQVAAFAVAIAFGIFAVKSVQVANLANSYANQAVEQALTANQLTLLTFCFSTINGSQTSNVSSICSRVVEAAESMITGAASALFTNLPPPTTSSASASSTPSPGNSSFSGSSIAGIVVGVIAAVLALLIGVFVLCLRARRRSSAQTPPFNSSPGYPHMEGSQSLLQRNGFGKWFRETFMDTKVVTRTG